MVEERKMKVGDLVMLRASPQHQGIIKEVKQRKRVNSIVVLEVRYKVFWFDSGHATDREYLPSDLALVS